MMNADFDAITALHTALKSIQQRSQEQATALPAFCYTEPAILNYEIDQLLRNEWLCLGRADEIPNPGDYFTTLLFNEPLLIVRGDDKQIRVLSNVCRHRNMLVAEGCGNIERFLCPYHAWSYGRDGRLLFAPRMPEGALSEIARAGLPRLKHELWQGFIYVNLSGTAEPLAPRLQGLDTILHNYHTEEMHHVFITEETWQVNWKCLVENFMEGYHLSVVHSKTLHHLTPTSLCEKIPGAPAYTGYKSYYPDTAPKRGESHPDLTDRERRCSTLFCVYPCQVVSQSPSLLVYMSLQPQSVDAVKIRWGAACYEDNLDQAEIDNRLQLWHTINKEDRLKLERLQLGLKSSHTGTGPLAPADYEGTIWDFYNYLAQRLL